MDSTWVGTDMIFVFSYLFGVSICRFGILCGRLTLDELNVRENKSAEVINVQRYYICLQDYHYTPLIESNLNCIQTVQLRKYLSSSGRKINRKVYVDFVSNTSSSKRLKK